MCKSENAEVKDSCLPNNVFVKICDQRTPPGDTKSTQKPEFDLFSLCFQSHNLFWIVLRPTSPSQSMLTHTASWRWQHATTRSWIWRRSVWETISFRQSRLWRAGRRHIDRGSEASKNRYFKSTCECFLCDYRYCFFCFFLSGVFCSCWRSKSSSIRRREDDRPISIRCFSPACSESESVLLRLCWLLPNSVTFQPTSPYRETHSCIRSHLAHVHTGLH